MGYLICITTYAMWRATQASLTGESYWDEFALDLGVMWLPAVMTARTP